MIMYAVLRAVLLIVVLPSRGGVTQDAKVMIFQKKKKKKKIGSNSSRYPVVPSQSQLQLENVHPARNRKLD